MKGIVLETGVILLIVMVVAIVLFIGSLFSVVIPSIIVFLLIREYKEKKKGKSR